MGPAAREARERVLMVCSAWIAPKSIKPLARHDVQKLLDKADKRKDIAAGYRELLDPPDVESLKYEEDEVAEEEEEEEAEEEQEEDDVAEEEQDQDGGDSDDGEGDEYGRGEEFDDEKPAKRGRRARAAPAARKRRAEAAAKPETPAKKKAANGKASPAAPAVSEEDILKKWEHRKGSILFIRHKIQKALLKKEDEQVSEADIDALDSYYSKLEQIKEIDISLLRATKIGKVMKRVIQLSAIPKDDEFHFRERSRKLIESWQEIMGISADDADDAGKMSPGAAEPPAAPAAPEEAKPDADEPTA